MPEYISIADFANHAGVTKQAIYLRLNKDLNVYLKTIQGKKFLHTNGLSLFNSSAAVENIVQEVASNTSESSKNKEDQYFKDDIERLNKKVDKLLEMLESEQTKNGKLQSELISLTEKSMNLATQAQALQGHMQQQTLGSSGKGVKVELESDEQELETHEQELENNKMTTEPGKPVDQPRGNWFTRIFK